VTNFGDFIIASHPAAKINEILREDARSVLQVERLSSKTYICLRDCRVPHVERPHERERENYKVSGKLLLRTSSESNGSEGKQSGSRQRRVALGEASL